MNYSRRTAAGRGSRFGGRNPRRDPPLRRDPPPRRDPPTAVEDTLAPVVVPSATLQPAVASVAATPEGGTALPGAALEAVRALAAVPVDVATSGTRITTDDKVSEKSDSDNVNKGQRKREKLYCYRCGEPGHYAVGCSTEVCDICLKPKHEAECPLLSAPKPVVTIYGVCDPKLMFFETPSMNSCRPSLENARTGLIRVTHCTLSEDQVIQQLWRLDSASFQWSLVRIDEQLYKLDSYES